MRRAVPARVRPIAARAGGALLLLVLLGGPTPGAVGSCSGEGELNNPADVIAFCTQSEQLKCVRRALRKEISYQQRDDCRRAAIAACHLRSWAPGCDPTERQARACINALRSLDTLSIEEDHIVECQNAALCAAVRGSGADSGAADASTADAAPAMDAAAPDAAASRADGGASDAGAQP